MTLLLQADDLTKHYPVKEGIFFPREVGRVRAVDGVSFTLGTGETLGLVGESGCGKSTTGRLVLRLSEPTSGRVVLDGTDLSTVSGTELRRLRHAMQIIFQDPMASLNPRMTVEEIILEPLYVQGARPGPALRGRAGELLEMVGLSGDMGRLYPHEFSGGQRQRIGIARAIAPSPRLIVCDEAVSALDVSVQAQIINLLQDLQRSLGFAYLFIAHDLAVVKHISDRIAVMYLGQIVETGSKRDLFARTLHPYSQALIASIPVAHPRLRKSRLRLPGDIPSALEPPPGCRFHTRCPHAEPRCSSEMPVLREITLGHSAACHFAERFLNS
jgi:oligopeptide transport system ATP-binding protein